MLLMFFSFRRGLLVASENALQKLLDLAIRVRSCLGEFVSGHMLKGEPKGPQAKDHSHGTATRSNVDNGESATYGLSLIHI